MKRQGYAAFASWAAGRQRPLIVGTDANHGALYTRESDFPDARLLDRYPEDEFFEENLFWTQQEPDLRDAWMHYLAERPDVLGALREIWLGGPSAVSYTRGSARNPVPDRFDYLLASPEFHVRQVHYDYEAGCAAGSDHAFLHAELELPAG